MPKLLLLDGNSLLYRGFFAMRSLSTAAGQPTNAIYSLAMMLILALEREKPDGVVCAWDTAEPTFRHTGFEAYKAQRAEPPEDLVAQRPFARELMRVFNIPMVEAPGWEADDIIGTLAETEKKKGVEVLIVTGDLDSVQLVDDSSGPVRVMSTVRGVTETIVYDETAVIARYGLTPRQIPDYKALKGDPSDNIPGVRGIGDKTASQLIAEFGSVEALLDGLDRVKSEKLRDLLKTCSAEAIHYKDLATIRRDVPLPGDFAFSYDYRTVGLDVAGATDLFERLEFRSLARRLPSVGRPQSAQAPIATQGNAQGSLDFDDSAPAPTRELPASVLRSPAAGVIVLTEGSPDKADIMTSPVRTVVVAREGGFDETTEDMKSFLEDAGAHKIVHDAKRTIGTLAQAGITLRGVVFDTLLAAYLLSAGRASYRLSDVIREHVGVDAPSGDWQFLAETLRAAEPAMRRRLVDDGLAALHDDMELPLAGVIADMERAGVSIDAAWMRGMGAKLQENIAKLEAEIFSFCNGETFVIGSPKQLQAILFEKLNLPHGKKTKTGYSTDAEVLEALAAQGFEVAARILDWRELTKLKTQYADALPTLVNPTTGRIHTSLSQTVASTGRLASSNPNLQNIPIRSEIGREIRKGFVAPPGRVLLAADYSQIELRIFAYVTGDPELMRTFQAGEDIHRRTAALIFGTPEAQVTAQQRRRAKTVNFALIYGMGDARLATELGVDKATAGEWKKRYFAGYPGVREYADSVLEFAREHGYVKTLLGRRRYTPDIKSPVPRFRTAAEREAVNMPVQGTCADIIKRAMIRAHAQLTDSGLDATMILQVHDELLFECAQDAAAALAPLVREAMESAFDLGEVPLEVDLKVGANWAEMSPIAR